MKIVICFAFLTSFFYSACKKEDVPMVNRCLQLTQNSDWHKIAFKPDLYIQLPDHYEGGIGGIEGPIFDVHNEDRSVSIKYNFCSPIFCFPYGDILMNPDLDTLTAYNSLHHEVTLIHRQDFCDDLVTSGIFYYNLDEPAVGILYWYTEGVYKQSTSVYYDPSYQSEIEQILQTIR